MVLGIVLSVGILSAGLNLFQVMKALCAPFYWILCAYQRPSSGRLVFDPRSGQCSDR
jgi:hypothetical protein